jgi:DNA-binding transcriptional ArsR family regulator
MARPQKPISITDPRLAAATAHPTRVHILSVLNGRRGTAKQIASELNVDPRHVTHHMKVLVDLDCVELVAVNPVGRGAAVQYEYTATRRPVIDDEAWEQMDDRTKRSISTTLMRLISSEVDDGMETGTFFDPDDNHISRTPMCVDMQGWREVNSLLDETSEKLLRIQERSQARCSADDAESLLTRVMIVHFRYPRRGE